MKQGESSSSRRWHLPAEKNRLGGLLTGTRYDERWHFQNIRADFYDLKGVLERLFGDLSIKDVRYLSGNVEVFLHPGRSCDVAIGVGRLVFWERFIPMCCHGWS